jgi:hypothetical protein
MPLERRVNFRGVAVAAGCLEEFRKNFITLLEMDASESFDNPVA